MSSQRGTLARTHGDRPGLPRGRASLPGTARRAAQRERLVRAVVAASAELGAAQVTVAEVVARARVSRNTFYEHFAHREDAFLGALGDGSSLMFDHIDAHARQVHPEADPVHRLRAALRAYLEFLAAEPEFARCFVVEVFTAGPAAIEHLHAAHARFASDIATWHARARKHESSWPSVPAEVYRALVGAMHELVAARVRGGRTAELPALEDLAVTLYLTTLGGWPRTDEADQRS